MSLKQIEKRIGRIKETLKKIGDMRPGSLSKQYNVCGTAGCRCKDPKSPKKHGPYHQLSYVHEGKSTTRFIRKEHLAEVTRQVANYKRFQQLTTEWIKLALESAEMKLSWSRRKGEK